MEDIKRHSPPARGRAYRRPADMLAGIDRTAVYALVLMLLLDISMILLYALTLDDPAAARYFHVDIEQNVPSTYSAIQLLLAGFAAYACIPVEGDRRVGRITFRGAWVFIGTLLMLMAADEYLAIHERIDEMAFNLGITSQAMPLGGYAWPWTVIGLLTVLVVGIPVAMLLYRVFEGHRHLYVLLFFAGAVFVAGAIGVEDLDSLLYFLYGGEGTNFLMGLEELMEMVAVSLTIFVLLQYRSDRLREGERG